MDYRRWLKDLVKVVERAGWKVTINGHVKFTSPEGRVICCAASPRSDPRHSIRRDFRRAGLQID